MQITEVKIRILNREDSNVKGFADVVFDRSFVIHGIAIINGRDGIFLGMPFREQTNGNGGNERPEKLDICHPITKDFREVLDEAVLTEFDKVTSEA